MISKWVYIFWLWLSLSHIRLWSFFVVGVIVDGDVFNVLVDGFVIRCLERVGSLSQSWILLAERNMMLASHWSIFLSVFWLYWIVVWDNYLKKPWRCVSPWRLRTCGCWSAVDKPSCWIGTWGSGILWEGKEEVFQRNQLRVQRRRRLKSRRWRGEWLLSLSKMKDALQQCLPVSVSTGLWEYRWFSRWTGQEALPMSYPEVRSH